jgi:hypothetical protein
MNWKFALALSALVIATASAGACGGDDCTRAQDQLAACAVPGMSSASSSGMAMTGACAGALLCQSMCINNSSCQDINGNSPTFAACMNKCRGQ